MILFQQPPANAASNGEAIFPGEVGLGAAVAAVVVAVAVVTFEVIAFPLHTRGANASRNHLSMVIEIRSEEEEERKKGRRK